ncbi:2,4-dihydroxyhept-2-ene-1,7-dioic acid aldolase [Paracoccus sp. 11-3]|uniref:2,4-dihydroxyhept-2-ene-1,7-dioic acid aldolase n=1 Tax=Paracoccus amoyensis TaxID=2760093 RepID=A0A926GKM4_9RHOB|nr:aldolase/citrate lyase family protein [Paracoccus amoyensis]MBC9245720.1 2,4-dihydroxyhept-2-ene-1,7-dioic acid aldolase [Paracoccus amoyensis]
MTLTAENFRSYFRSGGKAVNGWCGIPSTVTAEAMARAGFDMVTVDMQHGLVDFQVTLEMLQVMAVSPAPKIVRIPWNEPGIAMKVLDAGATGIICPMINTADEARALVQATRYAPLGARSFGPLRVGSLYPNYVERANELVQVFAMIETAEALENRDAIMAVEGLSGVYVGPSDLGLSMGYPPTLMPEEPAVLAAIADILASARKAGLTAGIHCGSATRVHEVLGQGFDFGSLSSDLGLFAEALTTGLEVAREGSHAKSVKASSSGSY